jgi:lysophospholipase L1-like esterase
MEFRTRVNIPTYNFSIEPLEEILFVGSCFADSIGRRFEEERFPVVVNPDGVMYNPVSVLHTIMRTNEKPRVVFLTLGTNHVYRLKETGEIVDNCQKRPQSLFQEEKLTVNQCIESLQQVVDVLKSRRSDVQIVLTVSPIRYQKYGFHESQLSKATLLLAVDELVARNGDHVAYFPAYEIVLDELRDYRFYQPDMIHPSVQTVEYIWQQLVESLFSSRAKQFLNEWKPIKEALGHRPFHPESEAYQQFLEKAQQQERELLARYQDNRQNETIK